MNIYYIFIISIRFFSSLLLLEKLNKISKKNIYLNIFEFKDNFNKYSIFSSISLSPLTNI